MVFHKERVGWIPLEGPSFLRQSWTGLTTMNLETLMRLPSYQYWPEKCLVLSLLSWTFTLRCMSKFV